jgi:acyl-coenzyme A thioesterase PaaI-like protein
MRESSLAHGLYDLSCAAPNNQLMDGLTFLRSRDPDNIMPMARRWNFKVVRLDRGSVKATACANASHENPFGVIQGGFAATVLDIALGVVTISVLDDTSVTLAATTDLVVRYFVPILASTGCLNVRGTIVNQQGRQILAEAFLEDANGVRFAYAQSNSIAARKSGL